MPGRRLALLACALLWAMAAACSDDDTPRGAPTGATTAAPSGAPPAASATAAPLTRTEVIRFEPPATASTSVTGTCFGQSLAVERPDGWRCQAQNQIYDPCFGAYDAMRVICVSSPFDDARVVELNLLSPACTSALGSNLLCRPEALAPANPPLPKAWAFETAEGMRCLFQAGGTAPVLNGLRVNYFCPDGSGVIGAPDPGTVWTARRVAQPAVPPLERSQRPVPETELQLRRVWW